MKRSDAYFDNVTLPLLYKSLVRSHLEYGNVVWGPFYKEDMKKIERVQRRATKLIPEIHNIPYQERLKLGSHRAIILGDRRYRPKFQNLAIISFCWESPGDGKFQLIEKYRQI